MGGWSESKRALFILTITPSQHTLQDMPKLSLLSIVSEILTETDIRLLRQQFVDSGKVEKQTFDKIVDISNNKSALATWLASRLAQGIIKHDELDSFKEILQTFSNPKYSKLFPEKDLFKYKTKEDISKLISAAKDILTKTAEVGSGGGTYVSPTEIRTLEKHGIQYLGMVVGYQVFRIPKASKAGSSFVSNMIKGSKDADMWKAYRSILGRCGDRSEEGGIELCTIAGVQHWEDYTTQGDLYVLFNLKDPRAPYQFHFERKEFRDKGNRSVLKLEFLDFFKFIKQKTNAPIQDFIDTYNLKAKLTAGIPIQSEELTIDDNLILSGTNVKTLPDNLKVGENLYLIGCSNLESIGEGLRVGGMLNLKDCKKLDSLPRNLEVGGDLVITGTPLTKLTDQQIRNQVSIKGNIRRGEATV